MMKKSIGIASAVSLLLASFGCASSHPVRSAAAPIRPASPPTREVVLVGNSVAGTVSVLDGVTFEPLGTVNIIPDIEQRLREIHSRWTFWRGFLYRKIKEAQLIPVGEPHEGDRFVDDVFLSPEGTTLYVSRSNLGDVAAFDLTRAGTPMLWRTTVPLRKADHATISEKGDRIVVSASPVRRAVVLETSRGRVVGMFRTGILPHQNDYSPDGRLIFNGSLGRLDKPFRENHKKGDRQITVVDATTLKPVRTYKFEAGVRPTVFTKDGTTMYAQLSYLNGVIRFDLQKDDPRKPGAIVDRLSRERSDWSKKTYKDEDAFPHNSAHHGLAMSGDEKLLCDCATVEDRVWIVSTADLSVQGIVDLAVDPPGKVLSVPYWATTSADGNHCIVSLSGVDQIAVINFRTAQLTRKIPVGDFPQRNRLGRLADEAIRNLTRTP